MTNVTSSNVTTPPQKIRSRFMIPNGKETDGSIHYDEARVMTDADLVELVNYIKYGSVANILSDDDVQTAIAKLDSRNDDLEAKAKKAQQTADGAVAKNVEQDQKLAAIEAKNTQQDQRLTSIEAKDAAQDTAIQTAQSTANTAVTKANAAQSTADTALQKANSALSAAQAAQSRADSAYALAQNGYCNCSSSGGSSGGSSSGSSGGSSAGSSEPDTSSNNDDDFNFDFNITGFYGWGHYGNDYFAIVNVTWSADNVVTQLTLSGATVSIGGSTLNHSGSGTMEIHIGATESTFYAYPGQSKSVEVTAKAGNKTKPRTRSIKLPSANGATAAEWNSPSNITTITLKD